MKQTAFFIQPVLPENMAGTFPVAVMTRHRCIAIRPVQVMAFVADVTIGRHFRMQILTMNPAGFVRYSAAVRSEMTGITPGNILRPLEITAMANGTG